VSLCCITRVVYGMYRWLDSGEDDGLIERELDVVDYVETPPLQEPLEDEPGFFLTYHSLHCSAELLRESFE